MMLITTGREEFYHNSVTHDSDSPLFLQGRFNFTRDNGGFNFSFDGSRERKLLQNVGEVGWIQYCKGDLAFALDRLRHLVEHKQIEGVVFHRTVSPEDIVTILKGLYGVEYKSTCLPVNLDDLTEDAKQEVVRSM